MSSQRENIIPTNPRFSYVTDKAYKFLLEYGYNRFPISPFQVLEDLSDFVICLPWSEAKSILKSTDPFHLRKTNADARTIRPRNSNKYFIVYDDVKINNDARISWTIMHEIGHIILGHLTDFEETALDRGGITNNKYAVLEIEAHFFAAEFLMPTALLKYFSDITVDEIVLLFGVSEEAAAKKQKRVFDSRYTPYTQYDEKLLRNFFNFLDTDIESTIYKNIYDPWGFPIKAKYVSICRKCHECYSYITDQNARYCPYCGSKLERGYNNMHERLSEQQRLVNISGISHPDLPYHEIKLQGDQAVQKVRYCPNCLNHSFDENADFCSICGQPLFNKCNRCGNYLRINDCFCPKCGFKASFHNIYKKAESRLLKIKDCSKQIQYSPDWIEYPYWKYVRMRLQGKHSAASESLKSALLYSNAYLDDDNKLIIFTDSAQASAIIADSKSVILAFVSQADSINYKSLDVYVAYDL